MSIPKTVGFPRMMKEAGEKRVFLPEFVQFIADQGLTVYIEYGYGSRTGHTFDDYRQGNEKVRRATREEVLQKEIIIVLRSPAPPEFGMIRRGSCLISMLHYPTRPKRVARLQQAELRSISLDSIVSDRNIRLVENMRAVAWNGLDAAFSILEKQWPTLHRPNGEPVRVLVLGTGMVGKHAVDAATKLGNIERNIQHMEKQGPGVVAWAVGRNLTAKPQTMEMLMRQTDVLVDATQRRDPAQAVIPNAWLSWLPAHAVIVDLAVDPYTLDAEPPVVRGVEGIPSGNLDKYSFLPDDPDWDKTVPPSVPSQQRRTTVSCYSWPGIHPDSCMRHYGRQLRPLLRPLIAKGYDGLALSGGFFERAIYRATLRAWLSISTADRGKHASSSGT